MNSATIAGIASTLIFAGSTLPMVVRAARTRDVSSYSRSHLFMTNAGNAVHTVYIAGLPPGPVWLLHCMYSFVAVFMFAAHVRWAPHATAGSGPTSAMPLTVRDTSESAYAFSNASTRSSGVRDVFTAPAHQAVRPCPRALGQHGDKPLQGRLARPVPRGAVVRLRFLGRVLALRFELEHSPRRPNGEHGCDEREHGRNGCDPRRYVAQSMSPTGRLVPEPCHAIAVPSRGASRDLDRLVGRLSTSGGSWPYGRWQSKRGLW